MTSPPTRGGRRAPGGDVGPEDLFEIFTGPQVPDPVTFVIGEQWLNRGNLYPRQVTLFKLIFLRDDLFTEYDRKVLDEWTSSFARTGDHGCQADVLKRIAMLRADGYRWFRETLLIMGRRGDKGHISALAFAYVLWNYLAKGDPQEHYGVDRDKQLALFIFAAKKEMAKINLFNDLYNVVTGGPCFSRYISNPLGESLTVFAPHDFLRMEELASRGLSPSRDPATFLLQPKESTPTASRGPAAFGLGFDEQAHVTPSTAKASAKVVYDAATPALDQFGKDGFIIAPSSPYEKVGRFYEAARHAVELDEETGDPVYPEMLLIQLASWDIYQDWEIAHELPLFPEGYTGDLGEYEDRPLPRLRPLKGAIQVYDLAMRRLERANPETFKVERLSKWQTVMDAYLNEANVERIFRPWTERPERYGPPTLEMQESGLLIYSYKGHADPSKSNCNFGFALAHTETDADGKLHCVFDVIKHWEPQSWEDGIVDYDEIATYLADEIGFKFYPDEITFDQFNSVGTIQSLNKTFLATPGPKRVTAFEKTATKALNWSRFETFKTAINLDFVHAPPYEQAERELKYLQDKGNQTVDHPDTGPCTTKDVADCMVEVVHYFLGEQIQLLLEAMGGQRIQGGLQGGTMGIQKTPQSYVPTPSNPFNDFGTDRRTASRQGFGLNRGYRRR